MRYSIFGCQISLNILGLMQFFSFSFFKNENLSLWSFQDSFRLQIYEEYLVKLIMSDT